MPTPNTIPCENCGKVAMISDSITLQQLASQSAPGVQMRVRFHLCRCGWSRPAPWLITAPGDIRDEVMNPGGPGEWLRDWNLANGLPPMTPAC